MTPSDASSAAVLKDRGIVYTFYSFKGGVGRSMALANVAALLSMWGKRVLVVDWDLEAPGIEKYFERWLVGSRDRSSGLIELVNSCREPVMLDWRSCLLQARVPGAHPIDILHAGRSDAEYNRRLQQVRWEEMFEQFGFGAKLEAMRTDWIDEYDFVLIDSRTGVTDIGGICTIHLPDVLVSLFTANAQSLDGVVNVMRSARESHAALPLDRQRLIVVPVPSRDESNTEYKLAEEWRGRFATELQEFFTDWIPQDDSPARVLDLLKIPYFAYWSFGERLPVAEEDLDNPKNISFSFQLLGRLLLSHLDLKEVAQGRQAIEAHSAQLQAAEAQARAAAEARERANAAEAERERARLAEAAAARERQMDEMIQLIWDPAVRRRQYVAVARLIAAVALVVPAILSVAQYPEAGWVVVRLSLIPAIVTRVLSSTDHLQGRVIAVSAAYFAVGVVLGWTGGKRLIGIEKLRTLRTLFLARAGIFGGGSPDDRLALLLHETIRLAHVDLLSLISAKPLTNGPVAGPAQDGAGTVKDGIEQAPHKAPPSVMQIEDADVYVSYRHSPVLARWLDEEFLPLFRSWVGESLGRDPIVVVDRESAASSEDRSSSALMHARCVLLILTDGYFASPHAQQELELALGKGEDRTFLGVFQGGNEFSPRVRSLKATDFRDFAFVGEAFSRSERYIEFQQRVRDIAERVANRIRDDTPVARPPFKSRGDRPLSPGSASA